MIVESILGDPEETRAYREFLTPEPLADGHEPEDRFIHCGMSWERYLAFDKALGDGQATMRDALQKAGAEPDVSWCLHAAKEFPDLVLEIALTSGRISKLELYRRFQVPEGWFWRNGKLEVFALRVDASGYEPVERGRSRLLPGLDVVLLERCVAAPSWREARLTFRTGLATGSE